MGPAFNHFSLAPHEFRKLLESRRRGDGVVEFVTPCAVLLDDRDRSTEFVDRDCSALSVKEVAIYGCGVHLEKIEKLEESLLLLRVGVGAQQTGFALGGALHELLQCLKIGGFPRDPDLNADEEEGGNCGCCRHDLASGGSDGPVLRAHLEADEPPDVLPAAGEGEGDDDDEELAKPAWRFAAVSPF